MFNFIFQHYTLFLVLLGTTILGITTGILGVFTFLRKQSLLGDAISHASLPGIALMFLGTHSQNPYLLLCGGAIAGILGTMLVNVVIHKTKLKIDTILGITLSVFFGLGLVLLTIIQKLPIAQQSILNKFLFGCAATLLPSDIYMMIIVSFFIFMCLVFFFKEFKMLTFDRDFAHTCGLPTNKINALLTLLTLMAILMGLQTVGVVLMSSMLIAPAAAARQWSKSLQGMLVGAGSIGACASICGTLLSNAYANLPTGPSIVVVASIIVIISLCTAR